MDGDELGFNWENILKLFTERDGKEERKERDREKEKKEGWI